LEKFLPMETTNAEEYHAQEPRKDERITLHSRQIIKDDPLGSKKTMLGVVNRSQIYGLSLIGTLEI